MKIIISLLAGILITTSILPLEAQELIRNSSVTGVCYAGKKINRIYIPPPKEFFRNEGSKGGGVITVNYTGFTSQAKAAVNYAVLILEKLLPADTRFTIDASWTKISTSGVLAQSYITAYAVGWGIDALNPVSLYPLALAEKIAGRNLKSDLNSEITLSVNSSINWYYGTDGKTPVQKYDLVTVAMHEICHGLGFFDSFSVNGNIGSYGRSSIPMIYDTFIENLTGNRLTDTLKFLNPSNLLGSQLVGNQLYFNGPLLKKFTSLNPIRYNNISRAKLYAPSTWDAGSSISHLDESATRDSDALMTPFIDYGEAIHNPGKYEFSILGDIGWINTRIIHKPSADTEAHLIQISLSAEIKSDTLYNHNKVGVVFSFDNFLTRDSLFLTSASSNDSYSTIISIPHYNCDLQYYLFAEDCFLRRYHSPSLYKDFNLFKNKRYHLFVGTDTIKPVIVHTPVSYYLQTVDSIKYAANVTDNLGVDSVYVQFRKNNEPFKFLRLKKGISDNYTTAFNARSLALKGRDSIEYRIYAVDTAKVPNISVVPKSGYFVTHIEEISSVLANYSTDFSDAAPYFFNKGFQVMKPVGFSKYGLNSKHPYESPGDNDESIEYTSILRHPLKFNESGMLFSFNEIVLVEPGETGSVFGSSDFYDYVIVEGSRNFGKSWFSLLDGYDCRLYSLWLTDYNSSKVGDNSTFVGTEDILRKHTFLYKPSDNISAGDTLLVRFRLFSDPLANGWGWVIEDLKINPLIDAVSEVMDQKIIVYPNPGKGIIRLGTDIYNKSNYKPLHYNVFNAAGIRLIDAISTEPEGILVNISDYPPGIYLIVLYLDNGIKTIKYSLIK
jgi:hypothetical protein